ncbi:ATP-dependent DNA helicase [Hydrogenophaga sp. RWCD_12]|uniref:ATP-dependent DNA helicase n=1 Tax=Hydrogenophaga sp. RWCD_12 TaxID=3391190 RepID=UPI0039852930
MSDPASPSAPAEAAFLTDEPLLVAVRTLCHFTARSGDLDLRFTPSPTGTEGIAGHQTVTARRAAGYQREVPLSARQGPLTVQGRADGFDSVAKRVEEIKTRRGDAGQVPPNHQALHQAQARVYGWMLCEQLGLDRIEVALVYFDIDSGQETVHTESCSAEELKAFFDDLCRRYLDWARAEQAHRRQRDAALSALVFPFDTFRPGQRELAADVYRAQVRSRHLLAQAPTGIGKTLATLFGGLRAAPSQRTDRLLFLTARTTGRQLALDGLARLGAPQRLPLRVLERVARDKACEHPDKACHGESCPLAKGFYDRLPAARAAAAQVAWLDRDTLRETALAHGICPYYLGQEMQRWCDVLVGDYNHWFDVGAHWFALAQDEGWQVTLLVDEAHNLIERARKMYSATLDAHEFLRLRHGAPPGIRQAMDTLHRRWSALARELETPDNDTTPLPEGVPADWLTTLQNTAAAITEELATARDTVADAPLLLWAFEAMHFVRIAEQFGEHSLCDAGPWASAPGGRGRRLPTLRIRNVVPGPWLQERWQVARSATLFSATLAPVGHIRTMLGLPDDTAHIDLPSPFAAEQLQVRIAPWISTRYRDRERSLDALVQVISAQYQERPGNYLAFFSSFDYLDRALQRLGQSAVDIPVWSQTRGMAEADRDAFIARFVDGGSGIGFAVLGGAFGEGIDLPGERLVGAFIATLGMPQVNADNERMRERLQTMTGEGHDATYLFPGVMKVVQAAGRVIRSEQDRGVVWLLDDRYARAEVRRLLPAWWQVAIAARP